MPLGLLFRPELKAHRGPGRPRGASSVSPLLPLHMAPLPPSSPSPLSTLAHPTHPGLLILEKNSAFDPAPGFLAGEVSQMCL